MHVWPADLFQGTNLALCSKSIIRPRHMLFTFSFHKLPDIVIKVNSFDDFKKSMHYFIKPTGHIAYTIPTLKILT